MSDDNGEKWDKTRPNTPRDDRLADPTPTDIRKAELFGKGIGLLIEEIGPTLELNRFHVIAALANVMASIIADLPPDLRLFYIENIESYMSGLVGTSIKLKEKSDARH